jgi:hypothetical protein
MLQELGKQNPALLRLINENQAEFLRLINEAGGEGGEGYVQFSANNILMSMVTLSSKSVFFEVFYDFSLSL